MQSHGGTGLGHYPKSPEEGHSRAPPVAAQSSWPRGWGPVRGRWFPACLVPSQTPLPWAAVETQIEEVSSVLPCSC